MKILLVPVLTVLSLLSVAQTAKKPVASHDAAGSQPVLKTLDDSLSYAVGMYAASFYKEQGVQHVNTALVARAVSDVVKNGKLLMTDQQANACIMGFVQKQSAAKAEPNKKAGEAFLAENKNKPGVITLPSGLQYIVLKEGTGAKPTLTDKVRCHYQGTLLDGTVFDSSIQRGQPIEFAVTGVIKGWTEALQLMSVGSKWKLFIPAELAYGDRGAGNAIQPGATLIFEVELLEIVK